MVEARRAYGSLACLETKCGHSLRGAPKCILALTNPPAGNDEYGPLTVLSGLCRHCPRNCKDAFALCGL
ncbi:hypothetical protein DBV15_02006 [Temnothorax longispinosus]|uniref:Uncharacterized protein n=1 Tax=Temnothorax longispinosus TaxID=300112 RepID=A0A4S2KJ63_9HYME|nr:hypothetical protein DBV15_02006 [Temnothorax longispinosus]